MKKQMLGAAVAIACVMAAAGANAADGPVFATYTGSQQGVTDRDASLVQHNAFGTGINATGIAASAAGHLYVTSQNHIYDYLTDGTLVTDMAFPIDTILYTAVATAGDLVYATYTGPQQGFTIRDLALSQLGVVETGVDATGIAVGEGGHLYITADNHIYDYLTDGTLVTDMTFPLDTILYTGVTYADNFVFASYAGSQRGVTVRDLALDQLLYFETDFVINGITAGDNDNLFLASANSIYEYSRTGTLLNTMTFPDGRINYSAISYAPAAVPEPASWAFMILGFGGVGGLLRRRVAVAA